MGHSAGGHLAAMLGVAHDVDELDIDGEEVSASFKFADLLRRDTDGNWRYAYVIWNLDSPSSRATISLKCGRGRRCRPTFSNMMSSRS